LDIPDAAKSPKNQVFLTFHRSIAPTVGMWPNIRDLCHIYIM